MSNFIDDQLDLPFPKQNLRPLPANADPTRYIRKDDWNALCQAVQDTREYILRANLQGFAQLVGTPDIAGVGTFLWAGSDGTLNYHVGGSDVPLAGGFQALTWSDAAPEPLKAGNCAKITMASNVTSWSITGGFPGQMFVIQFKQNDSGNHTLAGTPSNVKLQSALTLSTGAGKNDTLVLVANGDFWVEIARHLND